MKQRLSEIINENNALEKSLYILKQRNLLIDSKHIKTARVYQAVFCAYRLNELTRHLIQQAADILSPLRYGVQSSDASMIIKENGADLHRCCIDRLPLDVVDGPYLRFLTSLIRPLAIKTFVSSNGMRYSSFSSLPFWILRFFISRSNKSLAYWHLRSFLIL